MRENSGALQVVEPSGTALQPSYDFDRPVGIDRSLAHTRATESLPVLTERTDTGLVRIPANGVELRARVYGLQNSGPAVVLLHGAPGSSAVWDSTAQKLAAEGYRVVAYDQRGYSPGARPDNVADYRIDHFINDLEAVRRAVGFNQFHLAGHDIGAVVGWAYTMENPDALHSFTSLSIPNPRTLDLNRPYLLMFAIPRVTEWLFRRIGGWLIRKWLPPERTTTEDREYRAMFSEPGSLAAVAKFYTALPQSRRYLENELPTTVRVPTLLAYGTGEGWISDDALAEQQVYMEDGAPLDVVEITDAGKTGHFPIEHQRERVEELLLGQLRRNDPA
ncbi:MAG: alpha/beta hydrolase [Myxococcota bacterium]